MLGRVVVGQAAEREALSNGMSHLGPWAVLDSFRLNHELTAVDSLTHTATGTTNDVHLTFHKDTSITIKVCASTAQPSTILHQR